MDEDKRHQLEEYMESLLADGAMVSITNENKNLYVMVRVNGWFIDFRVYTQRYNKAKAFLKDYAAALNRKAKSLD